MHSRKGLWLFDNDGTLSVSGEYHTAAWGTAIERIASAHDGSAPRETVMNATRKRIGLSEIGMAAELMKEFEIADRYIDETIDAFRVELTKIIDVSTIQTLPGALEFLADLKRNNHYTGIVTGNASPPTAPYGRRVLDRTGLSNYLDVFAFADGLATKPQIAQRAVTLAREKGFMYDFTVSLGDSARDIEGGKHIGAFTVGVLGGAHGLDELAAAGADMILNNLQEYPRVYDAIGL